MAKIALSALVTLLLTLATTHATPTGRVVGGVNAKEGEFPHQVSLRRKGSHTCGGSILTKNYVLTAAHCVGNAPAKDFSIRAGTTDRLIGGVVINVAAIKVHDDYGNFLNDVALLRLEKPLIYSDNIQPIALATAEVPAGKPVVISGWGRVKQNGDIPQKLQWNTLEAITQSECGRLIDMDSETLICLAHPANNGACNGDSGGPATYNGVLVGVAGFVYGGCGSNYPDGYAKVYYHREWIKENSDL